MLFGHQDKLELFRKLVKEDSLSHAYLFYGSSGIGKFLFAKNFASFLESGKFEAGEAPLIDSKVFAPDEKGKIGVDAAREIKNFLSGKPFKSPRRFAVVRDAEKLTDEAQSALLKIVEEPPATSLIIFIAADAQSLFTPLLSRLTRVYFRSFSRSEIKEFLKKRYKISESKVEEIAAMSFGRPGRASGLTEKKEESGDENLLLELSDEIVYLYKKDAVKNSKILSGLLARETALHRYNLNQGLQRKAVEYILNQ